MPLRHRTHTVAPTHRDAHLTWVPESACVSVRLCQGIPPALDPLADVCVVPQAAVTYGQADLQQHCLAFIEGCTAVRLRAVGEHGMGYPRARGAPGARGMGHTGGHSMGHGSGTPKNGMSGGWGGEEREQMVFGEKMLGAR